MARKEKQNILTSDVMAEGAKVAFDLIMQTIKGDNEIDEKRLKSAHKVITDYRALKSTEVNDNKFKFGVMKYVIPNKKELTEQIKKAQMGMLGK